MAKVKIVPSSETQKKFIINCPGCNEQHALNEGWAFNGDLDSPTFSPSLLVQGGRPDGNGGTELFVCHSFITNGKIQFLGDCTHHLRNQTVDLIDYQ